jgi:Zn-dependent peptidase ImmA (M78 family)
VNASQILRVIDAKREAHPELHEPLTWNALQRILAREGVRLHIRRLRNHAQLIRYGSDFHIVVSSELPARRHTYAAAHELGHLWLHIENLPDTGTACFHMDTEWRADPREDDAEYFATVVMQYMSPNQEE